jgi:hypothetical protein
VVTLLALLELVRLGQARARQAELFGEIVIERNAVSVREPARDAEPAPGESAPDPQAPHLQAPHPGPLPEGERASAEPGESLNA